jgi:hypothetical protein
LFGPYIQEEKMRIFIGDDYDISNFYSLKESIYKNYKIDTSKFLNEKNDFTSEELCTVLEKLSSIEELCTLSVEKYLYKYNVNLDLEYFLEVKGSRYANTRRLSFSPDMNMYLFLKGIIIDFYQYQQYLTNNVIKDCLYDLVDNFNRISFGELLYLDENEGDKYLVDNIYVKNIDKIRNEISVCIRGNMTKDIYSSRFQIGFQELYICAFNSDLVKQTSDLEPEDELTLHFLFPNTEKIISSLQNEIYHVYNEKIWLTVRNAKSLFYSLQKDLPFEIREQFFYEIDSIPNAFDILQQSFLNMDILEQCVGFIVTTAPNYGYTKSKNIYKTMMNDLNLTSNIHYFNITKSILSHGVEGSLYLVEKYLKNMKTINIKNIDVGIYDSLGVNIVGFKKTNAQVSDVLLFPEVRHEIIDDRFIFFDQFSKFSGNINFEKRFEYEKTLNNLLQTYKGVPVFAFCFHFYLLFPHCELVKFPERHSGFFNVFCSITNKLKYKNIYFSHYCGFLLKNFDSGDYRVLSYFIFNGEKYVASVQHKYQQIYGYQYHPLDSEVVYKNNFIHYMKTIAVRSEF